MIYHRLFTLLNLPMPTRPKVSSTRATRQQWLIAVGDWAGFLAAGGYWSCNIEKLAEIINQRWSEKLADHKLREKREKYPRPENCERVIVPRVNPEIWARIDHTAKQLGLRACAVQTNLVKVGAILAQSTDKLLSMAQSGSSSSEIKALVTLNTDAMALLGHASCDLSQRRREILKPHLNEEYATLCLACAHYGFAFWRWPPESIDKYQSHKQS